MKHLAFVCAAMTAVFLGIGPVIAARADDLGVVRDLYAAASYEDALTALDGLNAAVDPVLTNQYRALCQLGLGKAAEAEISLNRIVAADPFYVPSAGEVSPRLIELFKEVRRRALPSAARQLYTRAKSQYDAKNRDEATALFKTLLRLFKDPDLEGAAGTADLKDLAEGFLTLADAQIRIPPPEAPAAAPSVLPPPIPVPLPRVYSSQDADVQPAAELERIMPRWQPPDMADRQRTFRGVLVIVIDEQGRVESASLPSAIHPAYDKELLRVAKQWRYRPATRQGTRVKYAATVAIVLSPTK